jgi:hypothetical protein
MNAQQPPIHTSKDLTESLKSPANKLALAAVELIRAAGPLETLERYIAEGLPYNYRERAGKARTKFYDKMVLDACFESSLGVIKTENIASATVSTLGPVHQSAGRDRHFDLLLSAGFPEGHSSWSGNLFKHILSSCFYEQGSERQKQAILFAKVLAKHKPDQIQRCACHDYCWVGSPWKLQVMLDLGADPINPWVANPSAPVIREETMIDCALRYVGCSSNAPDTTETRIEVIRELLKLGAVPKEKIHIGGDYKSHHEIALEEAGLIEPLMALEAIEMKSKAA